jgi:hypothetical protein
VIDEAFNLLLTFVLGLLFGYGIAKRPRRKSVRRVVDSTWCQRCRVFHDFGCPKEKGQPTRAPKCMECGAYHENYGECPLVAAGAERIQ